MAKSDGPNPTTAKNPVTSSSQTSSGLQVWAGRPYPLGATLTAEGINFALYSEHATKVFLCLYDENDTETSRIELRHQTQNIWHGLVVGLKAGQHYAYRVDGPYDPKNGHRFNVNKLLLDPYAKSTSGPVIWNPAVFGYEIGHADGSLSFDSRDSAPFMPKAVVVDPRFDWGDDRAPKTPWNKTIIYETHVKGFTKLQEEIPEVNRGTYTGLAHPKTIAHLKKLGVTAVELLPVHQFVEEDSLKQKDLKNYWGYNTIGYFAPEWRYASSAKAGSQVAEFKKMVKALHAEGLEVILDVVYNHTAEGNHLGPTLSFKGIDNVSYYRMVPENNEFYMDYTGCGNTLNVVNPHTLRLIMDSLRYWVIDMHVDGFRFDLASALARGFHEVHQLNSFFSILYQDPVLSQVKLIAEPWDLGEGGYQVGNFPENWSEWNDKYRDTVRSFWKGDGGLIADLGYRLMGSSDLYEKSGRGPCSSINFLTAHDGFTLHDLVTYNDKHNEANKEDNRDGNDNNHSYNWGVEGETDNADIQRTRQRTKKNFLATLFLSQGVPMLVAGDEMSRTQGGNNNAYCQDNEISWVHWDKADAELLRFTEKIIALRKKHPVFHRRLFFEGDSLRAGGKKDVLWFLPNGKEMTEEEWSQDFAKCLALELTGNAIEEYDDKNNLLRDDNFIWILNASENTVEFQLSEAAKKTGWTLVFDTAHDEDSAEGKQIDTTQGIPVQARSTVLIKQRNGV